MEKYNAYIFPHLYIGSLKNRCQPRQPVKLSVVGLCSFVGLMFVNQVSMVFLPFFLIIAWNLCLKTFSHTFSCWFYICLHLHVFVKKRTYVLTQMHLCFSLNALAFWFKRTCVLIQTYLRFGLNALAFLKELRVLLFSAIGEVCRGICLCFF